MPEEGFYRGHWGSNKLSMNIVKQIYCHAFRQLLRGFMGPRRCDSGRGRRRMLTTLSYRGLQELWPWQLIKSFITADKLNVTASAAVVALCHSHTTYCKECPLAWLALEMYFFVRHHLKL